MANCLLPTDLMHVQRQGVDAHISVEDLSTELGGGGISFPNYSDFIASETVFDPGTRVRIGDEVEVIALSAADSDWDITNAGGGRFRPPLDKFWPEAYGATGTGNTDEAAALVEATNVQRWIDAGKDREVLLWGKPLSVYAIAEGLYFGKLETLGGIKGFWGNECEFILSKDGMRGLDITGINNGERSVFQNFKIDTANGVTALYGYGLFRPKQDPAAAAPIRSSGNVQFFNIETRGDYHIANRLFIASESNGITHCFDFQGNNYGHSAAYLDKHYYSNCVYLECVHDGVQEFTLGESVTNGNGASARMIRAPFYEDGSTGFWALMESGAFAAGDTLTGATSGVVSTGTLSKTPFIIPDEITYSPLGIEAGSTSTLLAITTTYTNITDTASRDYVNFVSDFSDIVFGAGNNYNHGNRPGGSGDGGTSFIHVQTDRTRDLPTGGATSTGVSGISIMEQYFHFQAGANLSMGDTINGGGIYSNFQFGPNLSTGSTPAGDVDGLERVKWIGGETETAIIEASKFVTDHTINLEGNVNILGGCTFELLDRLNITSRLYWRDSRSFQGHIYCSTDAEIGAPDGLGGATLPTGTANKAQIFLTDAGFRTKHAEGNVSANSGAVSSASGYTFTGTNAAGVGDYTLTFSGKGGGSKLIAKVSLSQAGYAEIDKISNTEVRIQTYDDTGTKLNRAFYVELWA